MSRNRSLSAFLSVVIVVPLILGQSPAGGCGARVPVPSDTDTGPDGTLNETIVDSDGDGFTNEDEIANTPGTDPNDPTDNPDSVHDADADGCSDYDELHYENFCDNNPNTTTGSCKTNYYNDHFGFDLPPNSELRDSGENEGNVVLHSYWLVLFEKQYIGVSIRVVEEPPVSLADWVASGNELCESSGSEIIEVHAYTLSDGTPAYFTSTIGPVGAVYRLDVIANGFAYQLETSHGHDEPPGNVSLIMMSILDSFCVD